jgi:hypothetical protein
MARISRRRPSAATAIALLALFVALGGPAQAAHLIDGSLLQKGSVTGRAVKDRSLTTHDLSKAAVRRLRTTPVASVTEAQLKNGSVTPGKLARGAVGSAAIAPGGVTAGNLAAGAVGSAQVADGSLTAADVARYSGRFSVDIPTIPPSQCWTREPVIAALAGANISGDVTLVTPDGSWPNTPTASLTLTVYTSARPDRFVLSVCNPATATQLPATTTRVGFSYAILDVP